ncbi:MAG: YesL family protein [Muribaculaceae bacterium]|nr:YesL family protein [Roseburia sp.]MCM1430065.1 YesL family protein [Muribaculaceae bacterium]MCM1493862.1 YesL family protein [Muribaculaceae bacterium]
MKFDYDNIVFRMLNKLVDCVCVSFVWVLCCLPVVTLGAASSALYYTVHKSIRGGRGYVLRSFFKAFRDNFKQATLCWLVILLIQIVFLLDAILMRQQLMAGNSIGLLLYFFLVAILFVTGWCCVLFPYIARFANTVKQTLKNAVLIELRHLPWSLLLLLILLAVLFLTWLIPPLIFLLPAFMFLLYDVILERIFRQYMSKEDLEREMELEKLDKREDAFR